MFLTFSLFIHWPVKSTHLFVTYSPKATFLGCPQRWQVLFSPELVGPIGGSTFLSTVARESSPDHVWTHREERIYPWSQHQVLWGSWWAPVGPVTPWLCFSTFGAKFLKSSFYTSCLHHFTSLLLRHPAHHAAVYWPAPAKSTQWSPKCQCSSSPPHCVGCLGSINSRCSPKGMPSVFCSPFCHFYSGSSSIQSAAQNGVLSHCTVPPGACWASQTLGIKNKTRHHLSKCFLLNAVS